MNSWFRPAIVLACAVLLGVSDHAGSAEADKGKLRLTGSSTMAPLMQDLARRFQALHPGIKITVEAGGSGRGVQDAIAGHADIGMASRALKPEEKKHLFVITIARDGIAFVVHRDNPVRAITREQIVAIHQGRITNWKALGGKDRPIHVVSRMPGHSSLEIVLEYGGLKADEIKAHRVVGDNLEALQSVLDDPDAFVFFSYGFALDAAQKGKPLKALAVDGVPATAGELRAGTYPLSRPLNLLTRTVPAGAAGAFIKFAQSPAAGAAIEEYDFVPYLH